MSTVSTLNNNQFYQLPKQNGTAASENILESLGNDSVTAASSPILDNLDLSPEAQSILNGYSNAPSTSTSGSAGFLLSNAEQQQINDIIKKYKDAPLNQDTFDQIQSDLEAAGLSPNQLAMKDQINSFNPTLEFLDALAGKSTSNSLNSLDPTKISSAEQANSSAYITQIYQEWQNISTTKGDDGAAGASL